jgi:hypothetical protein
VHFHTVICRLQTGFSAENLHFIKKDAASGTGVIQIVAKRRSCAVRGKKTLHFSSAEREYDNFSSLPAAPSSTARYEAGSDPAYPHGLLHPAGSQ